MYSKRGDDGLGTLVATQSSPPLFHASCRW